MARLRSASQSLPRLLHRPRGHRKRRSLSRLTPSRDHLETSEQRGTRIAAGPVDWKRNLAALWAAEFFAIFGFSFAFPFMPLYLHQDLGVQSQSQLAFWTGLCSGVSGVSMAIASPIWGIVADRYGRKQMLLRAMFGGAVSVVLIGLCHAAWQLAALRFFQGATSGTVAAATALAAAETPRRKVAWALGALSSAIALGGAVGPMVGGLLSAVFGLRMVFLCGGILLLLGALPVLVVVRESPAARQVGPRVGAIASLRGAGRATLTILAVLVGGQCLMQWSYVSSQQMVVLRVLRLDPAGANVVTGLAFGLAGLATALASAGYSRLARKIGYRAFAAVSALLFAIVIAAGAVVSSIFLIVAVVVVVGFLYGCISPVLSSLIGLQTPRQIQATVYGLSASAIAIGLAIGPMMAGTLAAASGPSAAIFLAAAVAVGLSLLLAMGTREPAAAALAPAASEPARQNAAR